MPILLEQSSKIDQCAIDDAIESQSLSLGFPQELESQLEVDTAASRSRRLAIGGLVGLATYDSLIIQDVLLTPDVVDTALAIRLGVVTPIELLATYALWRGPSRLWRESIIAVFGAILPTFTQLCIMFISVHPFRNAQQHAVILVIVFVVMVQKIRFVFAVPTCLLCLLAYVFALHRLSDYPLELQISSDLIFASAVTFSLFVSYHIEWDARRSYLLDLKSRLQNRVLDALSYQDALTGLQNRRSLDDSLKGCTQAELIAVILADVDHFKKINDVAGHQAGDECLKSVAAAIRLSLESEDAIAYRYGGEEFLIVLNGKDIYQARLVAERMRATIHQMRIRYAGLAEGSSVTASFGVASGRPAKEAEVIDLISGADAALYAAKRNGRNQVWPPITDASRRRFSVYRGL